MGFRGIDLRETGDRILFRAFLEDSAGDPLATGTTLLRLYELQSDGTLESYDFSDNTFKATALTTATLALTHRTGNNGTVNTGIWTVALTTLTGFTPGGIYFAAVSNTLASPASQTREFQFGAGTGAINVFDAAAEYLAIADAILTRDVAEVEEAAPENSLCTIVLAGLHSSVNLAGQWIIRRTNDVTTHATRPIASDPDAAPITGVG